MPNSTFLEKAMDAQLRILAIGAHPDDCDIGVGGVAALYARSGHDVHFVALTNGDAGHQSEGGAPLARRRQAEARAAGDAIGIRYTVLDNHDGELEPTLANRRTIIRLIRENLPDLILTHRPNDYHPDHRYTSLLVQDAAYTVTVPGSVALTPHLATNPTIMYLSDVFRKPYAFQADVIVDIDAALEAKMAMLHAHASQVYEWLPFNQGVLDQVPAGESARRAWLRETYGSRSIATANRFREALAARYGPERGREVTHAEAFEISEYGKQPSAKDIARLFPF
jgi:LmbE family N-acetylglucosaminyl deacetylase